MRYTSVEKMLAVKRLSEDRQPVVLHLSDKMVAWMVAACLQLALRHPQFAAGPTRSQVHKLTEKLFEKLCEHSPALKELAEEGWDEA